MCVVVVIDFSLTARLSPEPISLKTLAFAHWQ